MMAVKKNTLSIFLLVAILIACIFMIYKYDRHILAWQANKNIDVEGVRLMMLETEVQALIGEAETYIPGFGGYRLEYPNRGIFLTLLNDNDTDFYRRVKEINIMTAGYEIYGIRVGDEYDGALLTINNQGFAKEREGYRGRWRRNMYIVLDKDEDKVRSITIGITDRVSESRVY